ncbi:MAG: copper homeostasis protein CutC, partial [Bacteroidia bacterium]|nr:copper homeostasis protein CutC [Bacteroidia bacterium]
MKLEICASNYQSALNAELGGADRIELCRDLYLDGLTPDLSTMRAVMEKLSIPVFVLIRPRPGDFVYNQQEFTEMLKTIKLAKGLGCHGIVSGVLKKDDSIDSIRTKKLVDAASPLP